MTGEYLGAFLLPLAWVVTPQVVWQSMQGYADVPMALMLILGTTVLWKNRRDPRAHVLAGVLLAGAALTKSEGTPLVAIVLLCLLVTRKPTPALLLGPVIVIVARLPWFLFTQMHGLSNHMINLAAMKSLMLGKVSWRLPQIVSTMGTVMFSPFRWGLLVPACLVTALLARRVDARLAVSALLQLALFLAIYQATWAFQGSTLEAFLGSNVDRVLITPLGVLALSVGLGWRESVASREQESSGRDRRLSGAETSVLE